MKIFMLKPYPNNRGPVPKHTPHLITALRSLGCNVITENWGRHNDNEAFIAKALGRFQDIYRIKKTLTTARFDVMVVKTAHDWNTLSRDLLLLLITFRLRPITVLQFHGSRSDWLVRSGKRLFKTASRLLMKMCNAVLVLSAEEQQEWRSFYLSGNFYVVNNPNVPYDVHSSAQVEQFFNLTNNTAVFLFVGRVMQEKGIYDLIEAIELIKHRLPCHLFVAGDGPEVNAVRDKINTLGLTKHVTMTGYLEGDQLNRVYQASDIFVLPTYWAEGFPTVIPEAMHAGLPIVTTKTRGIIDHLHEEYNALFVPSKNPSAVAETLVRLINDRKLRAQMSQRNREDVKKFLPEIVGPNYLEILKEVVNGCRENA